MAEVGAATYGLAISLAETVRFVYFIERTGATQATSTVVNLTASASYARVPCCAVAISHIRHNQHCVATAFSDIVFVTQRRRGEKKKALSL